MGLARPVLHVGDRVVFDGDEHQVVGLSGTSVRLRADSGVQPVVLAGQSDGGGGLHGARSTGSVLSGGIAWTS